MGGGRGGGAAGGGAPVVGEGSRVGGSNVALAAWLDFDKHPFYSMDEGSGFEFRAEGRGVVGRGPGSDF